MENLEHSTEMEIDEDETENTSNIEVTLIVGKCRSKLVLPEHRQYLRSFFGWKTSWIDNLKSFYRDYAYKQSGLDIGARAGDKLKTQFFCWKQLFRALCHTR